MRKEKKSLKKKVEILFQSTQLSKLKKKQKLISDS